MGEEAEKSPLHDISFLGISEVRIPDFVGHEGVTQIDEEIGIVGELVLQRIFIEIDAGLFIEVGIGLHDKTKAAVWSSASMEIVWRGWGEICVAVFFAYHSIIIF